MVWQRFNPDWITAFNDLFKCPQFAVYAPVFWKVFILVIMRLLQKLLRTGFIAFFTLSVLGLIFVLGIYLYLAPGLPTTASLRAVHLQVPLRVYSREGDMLAEYGEKRRKPLTLDQIPELMQKAILAAEDDRFFKHPGVDYQGLLRATIHLLRTGEKGQGGSTITMQLARNFFLTRERTYIRKLREILLALKIERESSKREILELYLNKIYLGNRAYGVAAAAEVYYGQTLENLDLAQIAMIAGLPKAPSSYNPIANPQRAIIRRDYVLGRMSALGYISQAAYKAALEAVVTARLHNPVVELNAPYVGEMVRAHMVSIYGKNAYTEGLKVITTISSPLQRAANQALRTGLLAYDQRHGYRGPIAHIDLDATKNEARWDKLLAKHRPLGDLRAGLVVEIGNKQAQVYLGDGLNVTIEWENLSWARKYISENDLAKKPQEVDEILSPGDIIRIRQATEGHWRLAQIPAVSGALVSMSPHDGAILALNGGFDFNLSKFNRATQARRQPGSNFKPFIYSAALERGFTPASIVNDAPVVFNDPALEDTWRPENYSGKFFGPTRLRVALTNSRNLVSIRLLNSIGIPYAIAHVTKFGFESAQLPRDLSLALGSGTVTPLELAAAYAVFANGGSLITPYLIQSITTAKGEILFEADPAIACEDPCQTNEFANHENNLNNNYLEGSDADRTNNGIRPAPRAIPATNAYQIVSMMKDVVRFGTGRKAKKLGRSDLAGKTGTTNDQRDAWFSGYNKDIVATTWVGFDKLQPLGNGETGAKAALPIWIDFIKVALQDAPENNLKQPEGMITVRIDPQTGLLASTDNPRGIFETFRTDSIPSRPAFSNQETIVHSQDNPRPDTLEIPEHLF